MGGQAHQYWACKEAVHKRLCSLCTLVLGVQGAHAHGRLSMLVMSVQGSLCTRGHAQWCWAFKDVVRTGSRCARGLCMLEVTHSGAREAVHTGDGRARQSVCTRVHAQCCCACKEIVHTRACAHTGVRL